MARAGLLLTNLGTPDSPEVPDVRRYLRQFLSDPRVVDLNPVGRFLLLNLIILPFRPARSAHAYKSIWTDRGSPLLAHSRDLAEAVQKRLGDAVPVELGMRYGNPSLEDAFHKLVKRGAGHIVLFPLYPQFATSTVGSTVAEFARVVGRQWVHPSYSVVPPFFSAGAFVQAVRDVSQPVVADFRPDHVLMTFHGVPERHLRKAGYEPDACLSDRCCDERDVINVHCYRAQCVHTARLVADAMGLGKDGYSISFQSRLGRDPWIGPATEDVLTQLPKRGVKRLAVMSPSFTADCLETLEELGIRGAEVFRAAGGEAYQLVPCLNAADVWVDAVVKLARPWLGADTHRLPLLPMR